MAGPVLSIESPTRAPRNGGLSTVAEFIPDDRIGNAEKVVFISDGCAMPQLEANRCFVDAVPDKEFDGVYVNNAITDVFTIYAGVRCFAGPDPDYEERANAALEAGRDRVLEGQLAVWAPGARAIAAGASIDQAVGNVEQEIDKAYLGRGVIFMSRADAVRAGATGSLKMDPNDVLTTNLGTPVIASSAVAPGTVYGLGAIAVHHTKTTTTDLVVPRKNLHEALAEAQFVLAVDCEFRVKSSTSLPA